MTKVFELTDKVSADRVVPDSPAADIVDFLAEKKSATIASIAKGTDMSESEVKTALSDMMKRGYVVKRDERPFSDDFADPV